jgi:hypothetical protein
MKSVLRLRNDLIEFLEKCPMWAETILKLTPDERLALIADLKMRG